MSHIETDGGSEEQTARRLPRGFLWPRGDRGAPRYLMKPPSRGAWRCKRGRGRALPLAVRTKRNAGNRSAPKPCSRPLSHDDTPQPPPWDGTRKGVIGHSRSTWLRLRPSRTSEARIAHFNSATPRPPRGCAMRLRGAVDRVSASVRSGGLVRMITIRDHPELAPSTTTRCVLACAGVRRAFRRPSQPRSRGGIQAAPAPARPGRYASDGRGRAVCARSSR